METEDPRVLLIVKLHINMISTCKELFNEMSVMLSQLKLQDF